MNIGKKIRVNGIADAYLLDDINRSINRQVDTQLYHQVDNQTYMLIDNQTYMLIYVSIYGQMENETS